MYICRDVHNTYTDMHRSRHLLCSYLFTCSIYSRSSVQMPSAGLIKAFCCHRNGLLRPLAPLSVRFPDHRWEHSCRSGRWMMQTKNLYHVGTERKIVQPLTEQVRRHVPVSPGRLNGLWGCCVTVSSIYNTIMFAPCVTLKCEVSTALLGFT